MQQVFKSVAHKKKSLAAPRCVSFLQKRDGKGRRRGRRNGLSRCHLSSFQRYDPCCRYKACNQKVLKIRHICVIIVLHAVGRRFDSLFLVFGHVRSHPPYRQSVEGVTFFARNFVVISNSDSAHEISHCYCTFPRTRRSYAGLPSGYLSFCPLDAAGPPSLLIATTLPGLLHSGRVHPPCPPGLTPSFDIHISPTHGRPRVGTHQGKKTAPAGTAPGVFTCACRLERRYSPGKRYRTPAILAPSLHHPHAWRRGGPPHSSPGGEFPFQR